METLHDWLAKAEAYLVAHAVEEARLKAEMLLSYHIEVPRLEFPMHREKTVPSLSIELKRLAHHEPIQYVLGCTNFFGLEMFCDKRALIPRPETEELVEHALAFPFAHHIDVGTGTGCIPLALAEARPTASCIGLDISPEALSLAESNRNRLDLQNVRFLKSDLLQAVAELPCDLITANLPYIPAKDCEELARQVRDFEPRLALDGGSSGLDLIERIMPQAFDLLSNGGRILFEHGYDQREPIRALLKKTGFDQIIEYKDFAGHDRITEGRRFGIAFTKEAHN